ncbi:hypothetical protein C3B47_13425 [Flavobacterium columnare]|nr:hypothetical protein [Flavobacterium columnare]MBF6656654.1 hypothetical protein [Flavobacterium columnare]MBF6659300.1 hypothetical protein [Flavobacterium columnare]
MRQCTEACDTQCGRGGTTRSNVAQCAGSIALKYSEALQNIRLVALPHLTGRTEDAGSNRHINKGRQMQRRLCVGWSVGSGLADVVAPTTDGSERVKTRTCEQVYKTALFSEWFYILVRLWTV